MEISMLFFGITKDKTGVSSRKFHLEKGADLHSLEKKLFDEFPKLKTEITFKFAVNDEYVLNNKILKEGDEVALIPPVSGG